MAEEVRHLFVYGSLLRGAANHARFCADALTIEPASTTGRLYDLLAGFPAMVEAADGTVYGEAMTFPDLGAALPRIDFLEGYRAAAPERSLYLRHIRPVTLLCPQRTVAAYCYVWGGPLPQGVVPIPSGRWPQPPLE